MSERMFTPRRLVLVAALGSLAACTSMPTGPSVMALPGTGQSFEAFRADDAYCRQYADYQIGGKNAEQAQKESAVNSAVVGTVVGAAAGALIGGNRGAATGAGAGLLLGAAGGSEASQVSGAAAQRRYDNAYIQCMYSKGHRVPVPGNMSYTRPAVRAADANVPPPPPGSPPPPPPGVR